MNLRLRLGIRPVRTSEPWSKEKKSRRTREITNSTTVSDLTTDSVFRAATGFPSQKAIFPQVPIFYFETHESDRLKWRKILFAPSGKAWYGIIYTAPYASRNCGQKTVVNCESCGRKICQKCIREKALIFRKGFCPTCLQTFYRAQDSMIVAIMDKKR
jgi:hypothetical protein